MTKGLKVIFLGLLVIFLASCVRTQALGKRTDVVDIPHVETWKEIIYSKNSNNDAKDRGQVFIRWFADPRGNGYEGMVLYHRFTITSDPYPIVKSWNFRKMESGEYNWGETRVAMWFDRISSEDSGFWFVGDIGERLQTSRQYDENKKTSFVTYTFLGKNSSVSKTIFLNYP